MKFSASVVAAIATYSYVGTVSAFQPAIAGKALSTSSVVTAVTQSAISSPHNHGCSCPSCAAKITTCRCSSCTMRLFSTAVDADDNAVPAQVEAMDGVQSEEEAHNLERPARKSIAKKPKAPAKPLSEFNVGETVSGTVKTLTSYGAFLDIGGETDGLLHISNLSSEFVSDVSDVLKPGEEYQVRILDINADKKQIALTLLTESEEAQQQEANAKRQNNNAANNRRASNSNTNDLLSQLSVLNIDPEKFVKGEVVNTVDFGAFVRVDCSQFSDEITGSLDGLVHISALASQRVSSVTDIVKEGQEVQVRLKGIDGSKVSLSMVAVEDEQAPRGGAEVEDMGNKDWQKDFNAIKADLPEFRNGPLIVNKK